MSGTRLCAPGPEIDSALDYDAPVGLPRAHRPSSGAVWAEALALGAEVVAADHHEDRLHRGVNGVVARGVGPRRSKRTRASEGQQMDRYPRFPSSPASKHGSRDLQRVV